MKKPIYYKDADGNEYRVARVNWGGGTCYTILKIRPDLTYEAPDGGTPFWLKKNECDLTLKYFAIAKKLERADERDD